MELGNEIIKILKKYSSKSQTMKLVEIQQRVAASYDGYKRPSYKDYKKEDYPTRRMVQRSLAALVELEQVFDEDDNRTIMYDEYGDNLRKTNYWYKHPLKASELRFIIDSTLYSGIFNKEQTQNFIKNIKKDFSGDFNKSTMYTKCFRSPRYFANINVLDNVEKLSEAIKNSKKIKFELNIYNIDMDLELFKQYLVNPCNIIMGNNAKYYLVGKFDKSDKMYFLELI